MSTAARSLAVPDGWKDRLYAAMEVEFALREGSKRDEDGQRMGIVINDTQVGIEFAMRWVEQNIFSAAPAAQGEAKDLEYWLDARQAHCLGQHRHVGDIIDAAIAANKEKQNDLRS